MKILFIVESPAKANTIRKILSTIDPENEYIVKATMGHIRDLEKKKIGVDIETGTFAPNFVLLYNKKVLVSTLKQCIKECDMVYIATDMDREGEGIAWHVNEVLKLTNAKRVTFSEITEEGLSSALKNAHHINNNIVNAQITRRIIDRIVGYKMTPLLWSEFGIPKLSSGRVQTAVLKLIVDNTKQLKSMVPYYVINVDFKGIGTATCTKHFDSLESATKSCGTSFKINKVVTRKRKDTPSLPFTTSTLQQTAYQKYGFSIDTTMKLAQSLYENSLITYMRTTSTTLSHKARNTIHQLQGLALDNSVLQDESGAHECIRPTFSKQNQEIADINEKKLYDLIYHRTLRSCTPARQKSEDSFVIENDEGFLFTLTISPQKNAHYELIVESVVIKEKMPHIAFNEATLIKRMDEAGIGRPSTYVSTFDRLYKQKYIEKKVVVQECKSWNTDGVALPIVSDKQKILIPTTLGENIIEYFDKHFSEIIDTKFTKNLELKLDGIENGTIPSSIIMQEFWIRFSKLINDIPIPTKPIPTVVGGEKKITTFMYNIEGQQYQVRTTRYGPVIENVEEKQFISLNAFLNQYDKTIETITKQDVTFLLSFPRKSKNGLINYGRFGFYIKSDDGSSTTLTKEDLECISL